MNYKIIVDQVDSHVHFRVFVNGALAGKLCVRFSEYIEFWGIFQAALAHKPGRWNIEFEDKLFWDKYKEVN